MSEKESMSMPHVSENNLKSEFKQLSLDFQNGNSNCKMQENIRREPSKVISINVISEKKKKEFLREVLENTKSF